MKISIREQVTRIHILELSGRMDAFTVGSVREEVDRLFEGDGTLFVVDLTEIEFMDSAGMAALVSLLKRARQRDGNVVLVKPADPSAFRILTLTRFDQVFAIADTAAEAVRQL